MFVLRVLFFHKAFIENDIIAVNLQGEFVLYLSTAAFYVFREGNLSLQHAFQSFILCSWKRHATWLLQLLNRESAWSSKKQTGQSRAQFLLRTNSRYCKGEKSCWFYTACISFRHQAPSVRAFQKIPCATFWRSSFDKKSLLPYNRI